MCSEVFLECRCCSSEMRVETVNGNKGNKIYFGFAQHPYYFVKNISRAGDKIITFLVVMVDID